MAIQVTVPKIGFSMSEGVLSEWLVEDGAQVVEGQALYSMESEKSTNEVESPATGTLKIIGEIGETYEVGTVIAEIG
ncbi:biotin/lipoyl-containing protein [Sphingorhabdus sp.]|jgi:pyruvate/2-oxoglutarate dehydrogenase complex dihydrolipoamide acyltransferase (E2) component|uniref:biotin/lipoyl-containing protein n=1 Tax=Sphingorhabdus sp. TaxID=1902408 RepID=UPI0037CC7D8D